MKEAIKKKLYNKNGDIKYSGCLSYKGLKLIGLVFLSISQITAAFVLAKVIYSFVTNQSVTFNMDLVNLLDFLSNIGLPLMLISMFSNMMFHTNSAIKKTILYFVLAVIFYFVQVIAFDQIIVSIANKFVFKLGLGVIDNMADKLSTIFSTFYNFNVFIDFFICALFYLFFMYEPKKIKKEKLKYYRLLSIIPILYIVTSVILIGLNKTNIIHLPVQISSLLIYREPIVFIFFISYCLYMKYRKSNFLKYKGNEKKYEKYLKSNNNNLNIVLFLIINLIVLCLIDYLLHFIPGITAWGFGKSYLLICAVPILLLFNPNKVQNNKIIDKVTLGYYVVDYFILIILYVYVGVNSYEILLALIKNVKDYVPLIKDVINAI